MRLYRHCYRCVGNAEGGFGYGVSRARGNDYYIKQIFRPYRLRGGYIVYYLFAANFLYFFYKVLRFAEAGVGIVYYLRHYRFDFYIVPCKLLKGGKGFFYCTERAAERISKRYIFHVILPLFSVAELYP